MRMLNGQLAPAVEQTFFVSVLQVFTQVSLVLLLWGTMCGGLALISDVGYMLVQKLTTDQGWSPPEWLNGRTCMTAVALFVLFPLCLQRHMREVGAQYKSMHSPSLLYIFSTTHLACMQHWACVWPLHTACYVSTTAPLAGHL